MNTPRTSEALGLTESCLLHARYHGLLSAHVVVQEVMNGLAHAVGLWSEQERVAAQAWCERAAVPGLVSTPAPAHVNALIQRAHRPITSNPSDADIAA
jgi:hypothetical protein